jgi:hypothetical protein
VLKSLLYAVSMLALICAGAVFSLCIHKCQRSFLNNNHNAELSIIERFHRMGNLYRQGNEESPLVSQSMDFALYLNPPAPQEEQAPNIFPPIRSLRVTPKFILLATSLNIDRPDNSVALVSEPGKGDHWIEKGERVGNFVVEEIEKGAIFYRRGTELVKMKVIVPEATQISQVISEEKPQIEEPDTELNKESRAPISHETLRHTQGLSDTLQPSGFIAQE